MPNAHLAIAGEGALRTKLEETIRENNLASRVHLLGFRQDADRWLSAASVVIHPSLQEGLSLVLIQAQMLRKIIVSTALAAQPKSWACMNHGPAPPG